jgi:hypothetical protein
MRRIKTIKVKIATKPNIHIGDHFVYKDIEWICLDIINGNCLAITAKVWKELPFNVGNHNNWEKSSLRTMLNYMFLDNLYKGHLVMQTSDMIADNGDKQYGSCEDYVTILSCDQYRKYRDLVPNYPECMWTLTPWSCFSGTGYVRFVRPTGNIDDGSACLCYGVAPVVLFSFEILKSLRCLKNQIN